MALENIRINGYPQSDRQEVEATVAQSVQDSPERFITAYLQDPKSFGGRYVAADLFKETFSQYREGKESRNRYNSPVHNAAAVLSAELFRRNLADKSRPEQDTVIFLTGIPGAGKTSSVLAGGMLPSHCKMVFEGQLSNPETTLEKIQQALGAGLKVQIIAVHAKPENALQNTFRRFNEMGRGASIHAMSNIQGGLPSSLEKVQKVYGDRVEFTVFDYRDRSNHHALNGWEHLPILKSEGNHDHIKSRLTATAHLLHAAGAISHAAFAQASGVPFKDLADASDDRHEQDVNRRGISSGDCEEPVVNESAAPACV